MSEDEDLNVEDVAKLYILDARDEMGRMPESLQDLIDSVDDHNQLMLDVITDLSERQGKHLVDVLTDADQLVSTPSSTRCDASLVAD
jgi:hypothetical protein